MKPPQTPRKRQYSSSSILTTPQNKRQLIEAQTALLKEENLTRSVRVLFNKTAKAFGQLHVEKAQNLQQLSHHSAKLEELNAKHKKKAVVDSNEQFINIETLKATQQALQAKQATNEERQQRLQARYGDRDQELALRRAAEQAKQLQIDGMSFVFSQFE